MGERDEPTEAEVDTFVDALDNWRLVRLEINGVTTHYAAPNDRRALDALMLSDLRPWPAMDGFMALERVLSTRPTPPEED